MHHACQKKTLSGHSKHMFALLALPDEVREVGRRVLFFVAGAKVVLVARLELAGSLLVIVRRAVRLGNNRHLFDATAHGRTRKAVERGAPCRQQRGESGRLKFPDLFRTSNRGGRRLTERNSASLKYILLYIFSSWRELATMTQNELEKISKIVKWETHFP